MSIRGPDFAPRNWYVIYHDGRILSDNDTNWKDISIARDFGRHEQLYVLSEPAASITAVVGAREYTLRAPDQNTHFFREYRGRIPLSTSGAQAELLYHAIGYVCTSGRVTLEIDPRGNCQCRFYPFEVTS